MKHALILHNNTDTAWTTGPCLILSTNRPLSEDLLRYTPINDRCEIPVTTSINVAHNRTEAEIDRKLKAHSPAHNKYLDHVTLEGKLHIQNYETKNVEIFIVASVPGKPIFASDDGLLKIDTSELKLLKRSGKIHWTVKLEPNQSKTLKYKYERYVPSD